MGIFRTTNPLEFDDIDGIIINEQTPPASIQGVGANTVALVGLFQRGSEDLQEVFSIADFHEKYGKSSFAGNLALKNKRFGRLKIVRVVAASGGAKGAATFDDGDSTDIITFTAKHKGVYGNSITVTIAAGTTTGRKYTISDGNTDAVLPDEVYDDIEIDAITASTFALSKLVDVTVLATSAEPANASATALTSGSDGSVADTDYQTAIAKLSVERACNLVILDTYNSTRNGYLATHVGTTKDKMAVVCGAAGDSVSTAISAVASNRSDRLIYGYPYVKTTIDGATVTQNPASWIASIFSQVSPHVDLAYAANTPLMAGATGLDVALTRANYVALNEVGICSLEYDADLGGFKVKNSVTTQIVNSALRTVLRRRMADWLQDSIAYFLKNYQNAPNTLKNRTEVKGAILGFVRNAERDGILPSDNEVSGGSAKLVDTDSLNTDDVLAAGFFKILYKQRIYSSMRFIVLQAEIGESVVVTEAA